MSVKFIIHFHSPMNFKVCPRQLNASWDTENLFINITLYEVIDICVNDLCSESMTELKILKGIILIFDQM